ncbi:hypothetical protein [Crenobacter caeni]|uniref:hypothetical protein n=1 Tax=Crenobacter caeni TaxID=2705474 RepID=UPI00193F0254|nr:hypothetical protein [Crenobacter caeni]
MRKVIATIKNISEAYRLDSFEWDVPGDCPIEISSDILTGYKKNIFLKENLHLAIKADSTLATHYWVIQKWGGIGSFKKNERNDRKIVKFIDEIKDGKLTKSTFECISSLSKVASFLDPDHYVIYDSRAIYTLNWLLFNLENEAALFPQPNGRSSDLAKFDMQTIFRLSKKKISYRSYKNAYHDYCNIVKHLNEEVFGEGSKPYLLEMLLFMVAPRWTVGSIEKSVTVNIENVA